MIGIDSWDNNIPHYKTIPVKNRGKYTILHVIVDGISALHILNMKKKPLFYLTLFFLEVHVFMCTFYVRRVFLSHM